MVNKNDNYDDDEDDDDDDDDDDGEHHDDVEDDEDEDDDEEDDHDDDDDDDDDDAGGGGGGWWWCPGGEDMNMLKLNIGSRSLKGTFCTSQVLFGKTMTKPWKKKWKNHGKTRKNRMVSESPIFSLIGPWKAYLPPRTRLLRIRLALQELDQSPPRRSGSG